MGYGDNCGAPRYCFSKQYYDEMCDERQSSPCATEEQIKTMNNNERELRRVMEKELGKFTSTDQLWLIAYVYREPSNYVEQTIRVVILDRNNIGGFKPETNFSEWYPSLCTDKVIWEDFNFFPFISPDERCRLCRNFAKWPHRFHKDNSIDTCSTCANEKIYLRVPYAEKDDAKCMGARWDPDVKKWFMLRNCKKFDEILEKWRTV